MWSSWSIKILKALVRALITCDLQASAFRLYVCLSCDLAEIKHFITKGKASKGIARSTNFQSLYINIHRPISPEHCGTKSV